jgi:hypothetical protein
MPIATLNQGRAEASTPGAILRGVLATVLLRPVLPVAIALALGGGAFVVAVRAAAVTSGSERLPDLVQALPTDLQITRGGSPAKPVYRLGFRSAGQQRPAHRWPSLRLRFGFTKPLLSPLSYWRAGQA